MMTVEGEEGFKLCRDCGRRLPATAEHWYRDAGRKDGWQLRCKACSLERLRDWRKRNPDKKKAQDKRWRRRHPAHWRMKKREWTAAYRARKKAREEGMVRGE